jgi:hypothetical protein
MNLSEYQHQIHETIRHHAADPLFAVVHLDTLAHALGTALWQPWARDGARTMVAETLAARDMIASNNGIDTATALLDRYDSERGGC